jgi:Fe2+ or Zn2+ uptake regulation protein
MGEKSLFCDIVDDGIGREQASKKKLQKSPKHKSTGISVTKKRLEQLKTLLGKEAGVSIEDLYLNGKPSGTKVSIQIPSEFD